MIANQPQEVRNKLSRYPVQINSHFFLKKLRSFLYFYQRKIEHGVLSSSRRIKISQSTVKLNQVNKNYFICYLKTIQYFIVPNLNTSNKETISNSITCKNLQICLFLIGTAGMNQFLAIKDHYKTKILEKMCFKYLILDHYYLWVL